MKKLFSTMTAALVLCGLFAGCSNAQESATTPPSTVPTASQQAAASAEASPAESPEVNEEDFDFTKTVVANDANAAGLFFLGMPENDMYAEQAKTAQDNGFTWSAANAKVDGSYTKFASDMPKQLAAEGSGFTFNLETTATDTDALRPAMGFNSNFYFTADDDNLGKELYGKLLTLCESLDEVAAGWVAPDASALTDLGIHVYTMYDGKPLDITDRVSFGISLAEKSDGKILFSYGAVMVDRDITDIAAEGVALHVSTEEEIIWSDAAKDGKITGTWWIGQ